ncbi:hypothetical protein AB0J80_27715 [Actinoplanes sp. NPDC049548]|uniref:hypothetical protein n=1 Tax=Actinoplanes sp. NPDC049548 TaxID=3155152 RepID=UPI00341E7AA2
MSLTGIPLIIVVALSAVVCGAATALLWSRSGRGRYVVRTLGILVTEAALVLCAGLVVNRSQQFYPSWAALAGDTGTRSATAPVRAGALDSALAGRSELDWHPRDLRRWHLAAPPKAFVPPDYPTRGTARFPVLLVLGDTAVTAPEAGAVTVALRPTAATTATALRSLVADLGKDVRVTPGGWVMVAGADQAALAGHLARTSPGLFRAIAVVERSPVATLASLGRTPPGTALAIVRPAAAPGHTGTSAPGVVTLTAGAPTAWQTAMTWTGTQLGPALTPPLLLPTGSAP